MRKINEDENEEEKKDNVYTLEMYYIIYMNTLLKMVMKTL